MEDKKKILGIQGLRAIAVLAVIFNHIFKDTIPSGFLGVDIFFVISGFVITASLTSSLHTNWKITLVNFYLKRIRRIFPALLIFIITINIISFLLSIELDKNTIITAFTALFGVSNIYQIKSGNDYFGLAAEQNIYTHTWSLGVEIQLYLIFPLIFFLLIKNKQDSLKPLLFMMALSYILYFTSYFFDKTFHYYFTFSRLWEFLAGTITYLIVSKKLIIYKINKKIISILLLILLSCFFVPSNYILLSSVITCFITALLIYVVSTQGFKIMENKYLTFTGTISYSLYLYHLPLIAILKIDGSWINYTLSMLIIYFMAYLSFKYTEKPIKNNEILFIKKIIKYVLLLFIINIIVFFLIYNNYQKQEKVFACPESILQECNYVPRLNLLQNNYIEICPINSNTSSKTIYFVGDSHSEALAPFMKKLNLEYSYNIYSIHSGGLFTRKLESSTDNNLKIRANLSIDFIKKTAFPGDSVIITNQLLTWFSKSYNDDPNQFKLSYDERIVSQQEALEIHKNDLNKLGNELKELDINLILFAPFPDFKTNPYNCYSPINNIFSNNSIINFLNNKLKKKCTIPRSNFDKKRSVILLTYLDLQKTNTNINIFDPTELICDNKHCSSYKNNKPIYYDDDHINSYLAPYLFKAFSDQFKLGNITSKD